jgi:hypothetical protein
MAVGDGVMAKSRRSGRRIFSSVGKGRRQRTFDTRPPPWRGPKQKVADAHGGRAGGQELSRKEPLNRQQHEEAKGHLMTAPSLPRRHAQRNSGPDQRQIEIARFILAPGEEAGCRFHISLELECPSCVMAPFLTQLEGLVEIHRSALLQTLTGGA